MERAELVALEKALVKQARGLSKDYVSPSPGAAFKQKLSCCTMPEPRPRCVTAVPVHGHGPAALGPDPWLMPLPGLSSHITPGLPGITGSQLTPVSIAGPHPDPAATSQPGLSPAVSQQPCLPMGLRLPPTVGIERALMVRPCPDGPVGRPTAPAAPAPRE